MDKQTTFAAYVEQAEALIRACGAQRHGQVYWNYLVEVRPDISRDPGVRAVDPFYGDSILPEFLVKVEKLW